MANRQKGYGMTADLTRKRDDKWENETAPICEEVFDWIREELENVGDDEGLKQLDTGGKYDQNTVHLKLKDGLLLCRFANALHPGAVKKVNHQKMAFKQMENISYFLEFCEKQGVKKMDQFQTVDLYEKQNLAQVVSTLQALGRKLQGRWGLEAKENKREFTEEQLRASEGIIGLQSGSNKGASQAGQSFGKTRAIID